MKKTVLFLSLMVCLFYSCLLSGWAETVKAVNQEGIFYLDNEALAKLGENFLKKELARHFSPESLELTLLGSAPRLLVPQAKLEVSFQIEREAFMKDILPLIATVSGGSAFKRVVKMYYRWGARTEVVVSARSLSREEALNAGTLFQEIRLVRAMGKYFTKMEELKGLEATRYISAGQIITPEMTKKIASLKKGEVINISMVFGALQVSSPAAALEDGNPGQRIRLRLLSTDQLITGVVQPDGSVLMTPAKVGRSSKEKEF